MRNYEPTGNYDILEITIVYEAGSTYMCVIRRGSELQLTDLAETFGITYL